MKFIKKHKYIFILLVALVILVATVFLFLKDQQKSSVENKEVEVKKELPEYKIKGIDISRYQGDIDFEKLEKEDYLLWARVTDRHIDSDNYENIFGLENETEIRKIIQKDWSFWQACDTCHVSGVDGPVDVNYFRGEKLP